MKGTCQEPSIKSERPKEAIVKKKRLFFRFNRLLTNMVNYFVRDGFRYKALSSEESVNLLIESKKSLIRYGNGEAEIMVGLDMATQEYHPELRSILIRIIREYTPDAPYLLSLTNWNLTQSVQALKASPGKRKFRMWRYMRYIFWMLGMGKIRMPFLETDMFRIGPVGLTTSQIRKLWADKKVIIMVHNSEKYCTWFRDLEPGKRIFFVQIPDKNVFAVCREIEDTITGIIREESLSREDLVILVSAGPGSNVLCYNLSRPDAGYLCYDMGNFFHMHYEGNKTP